MELVTLKMDLSGRFEKRRERDDCVKMVVFISIIENTKRKEYFPVSYNDQFETEI